MITVNIVSTASMPRSMSRRELLAARLRPVAETPGHWLRVQREAMACRFEVTLSGEDARHVAAAREALSVVDSVEDALTVFRETSELVRVNRDAHAGATPVGDDLFALLCACRRLHQETEGAFDVTSTPLSRAWGFLARQPRVPAPEEIAAASRCVGMEAVELLAETRAVRFHRPGLELNLGAIGKGYALDRAAAVLSGRGVGAALVSAGGSSIKALGGRPDGWVVDLRSPRIEPRIARLVLRDCALGTSGAGEQFLDVDGRRYGHVLDPRTGGPSSGVLSVSVVADDAAEADALSTAFLVGGLDLAERYCASHPQVLALVTLDDGTARPRSVGHHPGARMEEA